MKHDFMKLKHDYTGRHNKVIQMLALTCRITECDSFECD